MNEECLKQLAAMFGVPNLECPITKAPPPGAVRLGDVENAEKVLFMLAARLRNTGHSAEAEAMSQMAGRAVIHRIRHSGVRIEILLDVRRVTVHFCANWEVWQSNATNA